MRISHQSYGKERIHLTTLDRSQEPHRLVICTVDVSLEGDFEATFIEGDNRKVVATDSMKNTVYVLARERGVESIDAFAAILVNHFVEEYKAVSAARVDIEQQRWEPIRFDGAAAVDAQVRAGSEMGFASAVRSSDGLSQTSGIDQLQVIKTARSGFSAFFRDRFATLADTNDRLFATTVRAEWALDAGSSSTGAETSARLETVRSTMLSTFARHDSKSVQETLHAMAEAVFAQVPEIVKIHLLLPNQHHLLANLEPFGLDNENRVFVGTDEPFGSIEATLER